MRHHADERGGYYRGAKVEKNYTVVRTGLNGIYHYIDDIVAYDRNMQEIVMNDCIRLDCTTLSPDFMTKLTDGEVARGHGNGSNKYPGGSNNSDPANNNGRNVGFKPGYVRNFELSPQTRMHVRCRSLWYGSYEADEVLFKGRYDFTMKLPSVPAGTYEVRMFTNAGYSTRGIIQVYIDGEPQGIPFDMRKNGGDLFNWKSDADLGDEEAVAAFDKAIHNLGWMKGPKCYHSQPRTSPPSGTDELRNSSNFQIRKIFGTYRWKE